MTQRTEAWPAGTPCWADLTASDLGRTQEFYRSVLGWDYTSPDPEHGGYCTALVGGAPVAGLSPAAPDLTGVPHVWQVYLATARIELGAERIRAAGGTQLTAPEEMGRSGRRGLWQDPTGASFGLWQAGEHIGFTAVDVPGSVVWCDLTTPDHHAARDFYAQVFGYHYEDVAGEGVPYATFTVPHGQRPAGGIGGTDPAAENAPAVWSVCFQVEDVDDAVQRVRDSGGSVAEEPLDSGYGRLAVVAGPDRESFAIMAPADARSAAA
ncbi:VOC family protein [Kocuria sp. CPCC 205268]|uniref:VOC family protein n=1 Tax=Kocuria oxytropis TaxID=3058913 RepID=UPI0034D56EE6